MAVFASAWGVAEVQHRIAREHKAAIMLPVGRICNLARLVRALAIVCEPLFSGWELDLSSISISVVLTKLRS